MSERRPPKRVGPPVVTALIAVLAGLCWWAQDHYNWLGTNGNDSAIRTTQAAVQPAISSATPSAARPVPVSVPAQLPPQTSSPVAAPVLPTAESRPLARHTALQAPSTYQASTYQESARIELAASTVEVRPLQPVASVLVSRRYNYRQEVSFTWSTESGTAKPGQDFMPVKSRTEYIAPGAPQTRLLVPIVDNPRRHLSRTFYVVVNTPGEGATLGTRTITQVTIPASD